MKPKKTTKKTLLDDLEQRAQSERGELGDSEFGELPEETLRRENMAWLPPFDHHLTAEGLAMFEMLPRAHFNALKAYLMAHPQVSPAVAKLRAAEIVASHAFRDAMAWANKQLQDAKGGQFMNEGLAMAFSIMTDANQKESVRLAAMEKGMKLIHGGMPKQHEHMHGADGSFKEIFGQLSRAIETLPKEPARMEYHGEVFEGRVIEDKREEV